MDLGTVHYVIGIGLVVVTFGIWARQTWLKVNADGKVTLDEILDVAQEAVGKIEEAVSDVKELESLKKADLQEILKHHDLPTSGNKAELIARIREKVEEKVG